MGWTRRQFLTRSAQLGSLLLLPRWSFAQSTVADDDHFFLQIMPTFPAGWDATYLFDARPLAMTRAGLLQNFTGQEPTLWTARNGTSTWVSPIAAPLQALNNYFSVLNGVHMSTLDGHDQNVNFLLTGDVLGGDGFVPYFNHAAAPKLPLDGVQRGDNGAQMTNSAEMVPLTAPLARNLVSSLASEAILDANDPLYAFTLGRMGALGRGDGRMSLGAAQMKTSFQSVPGLVQKLKGLSIADGAVDDELSFVALAGQLFRQKVARSAVLVLGSGGFQYDTHDAISAKVQPRAYASLVSVLAKIIQLLRDTPYDSKRSLLDVTTFVIGSEFGRTLRQTGRAIDDTGTDHNPQANTLLVGGKGIQTGWVLGETDFRVPDEKLSPAHLSLDAQKLKAMGRPFDFSSLRARPDLPVQIAAADYLNYGSLVNSLFSLFGVASDRYWKVERNGVVAPVLSKLMRAGAV